MSHSAIPELLQSSYAIVDLIANAGAAGLTAAEVEERTGLARRTTYRHLHHLVELGLVDKTPERGSVYRAGPRLTRIAGKVERHQALLRHGVAVIDEIQESAGESAHLTVYDHGTALTVATGTVRPPVFRNTKVVVGARRPAHASASGKVFLAYDETALEAYLTRPMQSFTRYTVVDPAALRRECRLVRSRGWAEEWQQNLLGVSCVAVAVPVHETVVGSLVVSVPERGISNRRRARLLDALQPAASQLGRLVSGGAP